MSRFIRIAAGIVAAGACTVVVTDAWIMGVEDEVVAGMAVAGLLVTVWVARVLWKDAIRQRARARALAAENAALRRDKRQLIGFTEWLRSGPTVPMQRLKATTPQPVLRAVRRRHH